MGVWGVLGKGVIQGSRFAVHNHNNNNNNNNNNKNNNNSRNHTLNRKT